MKTFTSIKMLPVQLSLWAILAVVAGCATSSDKSASTPATQSGGAAASVPNSYKATDGRTIGIGSSHASDGGRSFKEPHMDKCWIADGFNFTGYDVLYIAPVTSTAKVHDDETPIQQIAEDNLQVVLQRMIVDKGFFGKVVTNEAAIKPGMKALKLNNTIVEYAKGGGAARYFVGLYGGGQPNLKVQGVLTEGDKTVFTYTMRRSGVSAGARLSGVAMKDEDIQLQDIRSLALDLTDFMAAIAGKYPAVN